MLTVSKKLGAWLISVAPSWSIRPSMPNPLPPDHRLRSRHVGTALHVHRLAGDVARVVTGEKHRDGGDVGRLRHASERDRARPRPPPLLLVPIARLGRVREPRRHRHPPD